MHSPVSSSPLRLFERLRNRLVMFGVALEMARLRATGRQITARLTNGKTVVRHGLGRVPKGWITLGLRPEGNGLPSPVSYTEWDHETVTFVANGDVTFTALVF